MTGESRHKTLLRQRRGRRGGLLRRAWAPRGRRAGRARSSRAVVMSEAVGSRITFDGSAWRAFEQGPANPWRPFGLLPLDYFWLS